MRRQVAFMGCCLLLTMVALTYLFSRSKPVYLVDYHCYRPPDRYPLLRSHACRAVLAGRQALSTRRLPLDRAEGGSCAPVHVVHMLCCDAGAARSCRLRWCYGCR